MPWRFRRHENLYITSNIKTICPNSSSISFEWIVSNSSDGNRLNNTSNNHLFIPSETLPSGLYKIELTVIILTDYPSFPSSASVYIDISESTIHVQLIEMNILILRHDYREDLRFNPGQFSSDMNRVMNKPEVSE